MDVQILTLCHSAMNVGGNLSMLGAFHSIVAENLPMAFPPFALVARVGFNTDERGDVSLRATVADPQGRILGQMTVNLSLPNIPGLRDPVLNLVFPISGMELRAYGEHRIDLALNGRDFHRAIFFVEQTPA